MSAEQLAVLEEFEMMFHFLDNMHHCVKMEAITLDQANLFGWYSSKIREIKALRGYCKQNGFQDVVKLAEALGKIGS